MNEIIYQDIIKEAKQEVELEDANANYFQNLLSLKHQNDKFKRGL